MVGDSGKGRCVRMCREARVQARMIQGKNRKMGDCLALNKATSRRSGQRRDVPEEGNNQRRDVPEGRKINVAT